MAGTRSPGFYRLRPVSARLTGRSMHVSLGPTLEADLGARLAQGRCPFLHSRQNPPLPLSIPYLGRPLPRIHRGSAIRPASDRSARVLMGRTVPRWALASARTFSAGSSSGRPNPAAGCGPTHAPRILEKLSLDDFFQNIPCRINLPDFLPYLDCGFL